MSAIRARAVIAAYQKDNDHIVIVDLLSPDGAGLLGMGTVRRLGYASSTATISA